MIGAIKISVPLIGAIKISVPLIGAIKISVPVPLIRAIKGTVILIREAYGARPGTFHCDDENNRASSAVFTSTSVYCSLKNGCPSRRN